MGRLFSLIAVLLLAANSYAAISGYVTTPLRTLSDTEDFGGCMARLARSPTAEGLDCRAGWVSFSCSGDFASKDSANRNFETVQIALLTGRSIYVAVDDTRKHNGYCFAQRVDLLGQ